MKNGINGSHDIRSKKEVAVAYLFTLPSFIGFLIFVLLPIIFALVISLSKYNIFTGDKQFVGFQNYLVLLKDSRTLEVLKNTIWYSIFATAGNTIIGLLLAIAVDDKLGKKTSVIFRAVYFFPSLVGLVFVAIIWQYLFQKDVGVINYYLSFIGVPKIGWLSSPDFAKISVVILDVWKNAGMSMLLILSGLQNIDKTYYEASRIDGAGPLRIFFKITLPMLSPTLFFVLIMHMTGALRIFESVYVLTAGGPGDSTRSLVMLIAEKGFTSYNYGIASSLSMMLLALIGVVTLLQFIGSRWWVYYE